MAVHNFYPSACRECGGLYVNSTASGLAWLGTIVFAGLFVVWLRSYIEISDTIIFVVVLLVTPTHALWAKPIPYKEFKPYGKRPLWKTILIFGLMPIALILVVLAILIKSGAGM